MGIKVIVFDFDGTLVESNQLKYDAYFELFPKTPLFDEIIRSVLSEIYEESRYVIIETILRRLGEKTDEDIQQRCSELAEQYNDIVLTGAKTCPEKEGAGTLLESLNEKYIIYVSSTTPDTPLKKIIFFRNWDKYFAGTYGYPHKKEQTLQQIIHLEKVQPHEIVVIGDGKSDRQSAAAKDCFFIHVTDNFKLEEIGTIITGL
jgi:phosphoglycolate phosphatase